MSNSHSPKTLKPVNPDSIQNVGDLGVWALYKQSLKPNDSKFNLYFARPLAAPLVYLFAKTRCTPNQVTFISTLIMVFACLSMMFIEGLFGLWIAILGIELSYIFDCVDGQLARVTKRSSAVGGDLDFMMDELKAYLLIVSIGFRGLIWDASSWWQPSIWTESAEIWALCSAMTALLITASAITLTRFVRSERYALATGGKVQSHGQSAGEGRSGGTLWPVKMLARLVTQYPASLPLFALTSTLDTFLYAYAVLHLLYVGQSGLGIILKLGRFAPKKSPNHSGTEEPR